MTGPHLTPEPALTTCCNADFAQVDLCDFATAEPGERTAAITCSECGSVRLYILKPDVVAARAWVEEHHPEWLS